ncbi:MAG TPA: amidohydrolase family protein [Pyrinomonadaceae bacterium]
MRNRPQRIFALFAAAGVALSALQAVPGSAQQTLPAATRGVGTDTYAITNARVVTVSGPVIERGTVVVRDGLIAAVGERVAVPPDARNIDGAGLTVYPGVIDASTNLAIPRPTPAASPGGGGGGFPGFQPVQVSATSPNSSQLPGLQPEILAADIIRPGGAEVEASRNAGITAALTTPRGAVFLGQSALINLSGDTPQQMIVRSPVALHVGLSPIGQGQYPGSLMGVLTTIRQMLLDAQRYRDSNEIYDRNPRGLRRPGPDKSLAALLPVLARQVPVVMQAEREREITRALDIAQEFNLRLIINGGAEADRLAARLKAQNVPVLLTLNFPLRSATPSPEADPEPTRVLRERVEAPKVAGRLAQAGVRFAFQSGGMTSMADYLANAAKAVDAGLARDEAVRALTLRPAEILGVADRLGTIEAGKIANLTVTRGDIFAKDRRIAHVFIDGRPVDLRPSATAAPGATNATGNWSLRVNLGGGQQEVSVTLNLQQQGERLTGSIQGPLGSGQIGAGSLAGADLRFTVPVTLPGPGSQTTDATFTGTLTGNEMRGTVQVVGRDPGTFTGARTGGPTPSPGGAAGTGTQPAPAAAPTPDAAAVPDLSGNWSIEVDVGERVIAATLQFQQSGATLSGSMQSEFGTSPISGGSVRPDGFRFSTQVNIGQVVDVTFEGTASGNTMQGTANAPTGAASFTGRRTP